MTIEQFFADPSKITVIGLLLVMVMAFWKEWIVPNSTHQAALKDKAEQLAAMTRDRDEYRSVAFKLIEITERTQQVRSKLFEQGKEL